MNDDYNAPGSDLLESGENASSSDEDKGKMSLSGGRTTLFCVIIALIGVCLSVSFSLIAARVYMNNQAESSGAKQSEIFGALVNGAVSANRSVVAISVFDENNKKLGSGSGVVWSTDGYIVTCDHVTDKGKLLVVTFPEGTRLEASLVGCDFTTDISVIKVETSKELTPAEVNYGGASVGQRIIAIGNSLGSYSNTVTDGVISAETRTITVEGRDMRLIQMSAAVNPGNSGGGLFDGEGRLLGIVNSKAGSDGMEGIGFAIPVGLAKPVIDELITSGFVAGRPYADFESVYISRANYSSFPELADFYTELSWLGSSIVEGEYVTSAGSTPLAVGDRINSANGEKIGSHGDIVSAIQSSSPGDKLTLNIYRKGQILSVEVDVTEKTKSE